MVVDSSLLTKAQSKGGGSRWTGSVEGDWNVIIDAQEQLNKQGYSFDVASTKAELQAYKEGVSSGKIQVGETPRAWQTPTEKMIGLIQQEQQPKPVSYSQPLWQQAGYRKPEYAATVGTIYRASGEVEYGLNEPSYQNVKTITQQYLTGESRVALQEKAIQQDVSFIAQQSGIARGAVTRDMMAQLGKYSYQRTVNREITESQKRGEFSGLARMGTNISYSNVSDAQSQPPVYTKPTFAFPMEQFKLGAKEQNITPAPAPYKAGTYFKPYTPLVGIQILPNIPKDMSAYDSLKLANDLSRGSKTFRNWKTGLEPPKNIYVTLPSEKDYPKPFSIESMDFSKFKQSIYEKATSLRIAGKSIFDFGIIPKEYPSYSQGKNFLTEPDVFAKRLGWGAKSYLIEPIATDLFLVGSGIVATGLKVPASFEAYKTIYEKGLSGKRASAGDVRRAFSAPQTFLETAEIPFRYALVGKALEVGGTLIGQGAKAFALSPIGQALPFQLTSAAVRASSYPVLFGALGAGSAMLETGDPEKAFGAGLGFTTATLAFSRLVPPSTKNLNPKEAAELMMLEKMGAVPKGSYSQAVKAGTADASAKTSALRREGGYSWKLEKPSLSWSDRTVQLSGTGRVGGVLKFIGGETYSSTTYKSFTLKTPSLNVKGQTTLRALSSSEKPQFGYKGSEIQKAYAELYDLYAPDKRVIDQKLMGDVYTLANPKRGYVAPEYRMIDSKAWVKINAGNKQTPITKWEARDLGLGSSKVGRIVKENFVLYESYKNIKAPPDEWLGKPSLGNWLSQKFSAYAQPAAKGWKDVFRDLGFYDKLKLPASGDYDYPIFSNKYLSQKAVEWNVEAWRLTSALKPKQLKMVIGTTQRVAPQLRTPQNLYVAPTALSLVRSQSNFVFNAPSPQPKLAIMQQQVRTTPASVYKQQPYFEYKQTFQQQYKQQTRQDVRQAVKQDYKTSLDYALKTDTMQALRQEAKQSYKQNLKTELLQSSKQSLRQSTRLQLRYGLRLSLKQDVPLVPPIKPLWGDGFLRPTKKKKPKEYSRFTQYTPSIIAQEFKIYGKRPSLEAVSIGAIRPLLRGKK